MLMRFSIIVPCFNVAEWVPETLDSVISQKCRDWECLCVDDGSSDGTGHVLDEYAARDARITVIHQHNGGVGSARNAALDVAHGEYVVFLDGDDVLHQDALRVLAEEVERCPVDAIKFFFESSNNCRYEEMALPSVKSRQNFDFKKSAEFQQAFRLIPTNYSCMISFRRSVIGDVRFSRYFHSEDTLFAVQVFSHCQSAAIIDAKLYYYRQRGDSVVHQASLAKLEVGLKVLELIYDEVASWDRFELLRKILYKRTIWNLSGFGRASVEQLSGAERTRGWKTYLGTICRLYKRHNFAPGYFTRVWFISLGSISWSLVAAWLQMMHKAKVSAAIALNRIKRLG